jgi:hypothetical protein
VINAKVGRLVGEPGLLILGVFIGLGTLALEVEVGVQFGDESHTRGIGLSSKAKIPRSVFYFTLIN